MGMYLQCYMQLISESSPAIVERRKKKKVDPNNPMLQNAIAKTDMNAYAQLREADPLIATVLPGPVAPMISVCGASSRSLHGFVSVDWATAPR